MPYLAYRKSTGEVIPDFQSHATPAGLTANAVRGGIPAEDVTVRLVEQWEYDQQEEAAFGPVRRERAAKAREAEQRGHALVKKLGLSDAEAQDLAQYLATLR